MKKTKLFILIASLVTACFLLTACSSAGDGYMGSEFDSYTGGSQDGFHGQVGGLIINNDADFDGTGSYVHDKITEVGFSDTSEQPSSYFSLDRNTACYSLIRRQLNEGKKVSPDSVRIEEMLNYFDYPLPKPEEEAIAVTTELMTCPWNKSNKLMMIGVTSKEVVTEGVNGNYVFLIDVSGSMSGKRRLEYAKLGVCTLIDALGEGDVVSIVTYAGGVDKIADGVECNGAHKYELKKTVNGLRASGSTNGEGGLELAYGLAKEHFITGGNNRVVIISDGDFNVGVSNTETMREYITEQAKSGVYLSVVGVGMGNTRDDMLETLAKTGNGNYSYMDSASEARKIFVHDLKGNLFTVAKDAKAGVTFDADTVEKYRLIGYDAKRMSQDEFNSTDTDSGEIGSGLEVIALYEVTLRGSAEGNIATAEIRYKDVNEDEADKSVTSVVTTATPMTVSIEYAACVAEFGLLLRNSIYRGNASAADIKERLEDLGDRAEQYIDDYNYEFYELVCKALMDELY